MLWRKVHQLILFLSLFMQRQFQLCISTKWQALAAELSPFCTEISFFLWYKNLRESEGRGHAVFTIESHTSPFSLVEQNANKVLAKEAEAAATTTEKDQIALTIEFPYHHGAKTLRDTLDFRGVDTRHIDVLHRSPQKHVSWENPLVQMFKQKFCFLPL